MGKSLLKLYYSIFPSIILLMSPIVVYAQTSTTKLVKVQDGMSFPNALIKSVLEVFAMSLLIAFSFAIFKYLFSKGKEELPKEESLK